MDVAVLPAVSALAGSLIGGLSPSDASFGHKRSFRRRPSVKHSMQNSLRHRDDAPKPGAARPRVRRLSPVSTPASNGCVYDHLVRSLAKPSM